MARVAILNSRQSKTPTVQDEWVSQTIAAVGRAQTDGDDIVSSIGQFTWDLVSWEAFNRGVNLHLVVPRLEPRRLSHLSRDIFGPLDPGDQRINWVFLDTESPVESKKWWRERDRMVLELADTVRPVSLRPKSGWEELLGPIRDQRRIDHRFVTSYKPKAHHLRVAVDTERLHPALADWPKRFLIHWTRASHGPWPGETKADFFRDFVRDQNEPSAYCRSAFHTLQRIISEGRIRASSWRVGSGVPMVALTECSPLDSLPLIRWRARWSRWSFEPYGIALDRDWLAARGARPIRYLDEIDWKALSAEQKPWCHQSGENADVWPAEREWRVQGDLILAGVPRDAIRLIVRLPIEREHLQRRLDLDVIPMMTGE